MKIVKIDLIDTLDGLIEKKITQIDATNLMYTEINKRKLFLTDVKNNSNNVTSDTELQIENCNTMIKVYKAYIYQKLLKIEV